MKILLAFLVIFAIFDCIYAQRSVREYFNTQKGSKKYCKKNYIEVEVHKIINFNSPCAQYECLPDYTLREIKCQNVQPQNEQRFPECCADHMK